LLPLSRFLQVFVAFRRTIVGHAHRLSIRHATRAICTRRKAVRSLTHRFRQPILAREVLFLRDEEARFAPVCVLRRRLPYQN
jgi:hypothetical protein